MKFMRNHWYDVAPGLVYLAVFIGGFMLKIGYGVLKKTDSPYFFPKEEFEDRPFDRPRRDRNDRDRKPRENKTHNSSFKPYFKD